ncbi:NAD(P)/FAD-dependent oxidoreductase [Nitrincola sp. MINF-07-Sa-05]|uniref:NAD(P)/FAD-dependent oxidoreductase n=1 Tax=Nitrincola salilacus TaxID=3400273 RepID=UPI00391839B7
MKINSLAVIGAGIAGMVVARTLADAGVDVTVFDKSRGSGGRFASTRVGDLTADLGAPWIVSEQTAMGDWLTSYSDVTASWTPARADFSLVGAGDGLTGLVAIPRSSALTRQLGAGCRLVPETLVTVVWPDQQGVILRDGGSEPLGHFDAVVVATPAPQALPLLDAVPRFRQRAGEAGTVPAWVCVVELDARPERLVSADWLEGDHPLFRRVVRDSSKPGRTGEIWVLEAQALWSQEYIHLTPETVGAEMQAAFEVLAGEPLSVLSSRVHRWLYAHATPCGCEELSFWDPGTGIGACGDWLHAGGVEGSWQSGVDLARQLLAARRDVA